MTTLQSLSKDDLRSLLLRNHEWGKKEGNTKTAIRYQKALTYEVKRRIIAADGAIENPGEPDAQAERALLTQFGF